MKTCPQCKESKDESDFYRKTKTRLQSMCKPCFNTYTMNRWNQRKLEAIKYKGGKCVDCNQSYHYAAFDFHHLDPGTKEFGWVKMRLISKVKMLKELDKCALLCSNCHRIRHAF
jgi:hypothetical protein